MGQQANITLNTVVYVPGGTSNGTSAWLNRSGGFGNSFSKVTEKFDPSTKGNLVRQVYSLELPIVAATDTSCACAGTLLRTSTVHLSVWVPQDSTAAERLDLYNRIKDFVASTPFVNGVQNLEFTYG